MDLLTRGTLASPTLVGQILLDEGGRITFRDVRYEIEQGTIAFANTEGFEPIIDIRVRAEVKGYDVGVSLVGTWPRIQTSLSSDPPLPDEMIVGLLVTGTTPGGQATPMIYQQNGREYLVKVQPREQGLIMYTLRHASEIRSMDAIDELTDVPEQVKPQEVALARHVIAAIQAAR